MPRLLQLLFVLLLANAPAISQSSRVSQWRLFISRAGWSLRYPPQALPTGCRQCADLTAPDVAVFFSFGGDGVMIEPLADKPPDHALADWLKAVARDTVLVPVINDEWIEVDGIRALKVRNGGAGRASDNIYFVHGLKTFAVRSPDVQSKNYRLYLEILGTFHFSP